MPTWRGVKLACDLRAEHEPVEPFANAALVASKREGDFGRSQVLAARRE